MTRRRPGTAAPWVVTLRNFISDEEADAFIEGCRPHFERSLAGDQLSPVRTSQQCWCAENECAQNPLTARVEERVRNLTNVPSISHFEPFQVLRLPGCRCVTAPPANSQHFEQPTLRTPTPSSLIPDAQDPPTSGALRNVLQIHGALGRPVTPRVTPQVLKYAPHQFYRVHHDQNSGHFTPQGVRIYTFFMYLSTPEEGGGTRFDDLDVVVPAVKGTAVLWPSVTDADPSADEPNTNHEGLPPVRGVKYAANAWIHNHDYRTPASTNCILAHKNTHSPIFGTGAR